MREKTVLFVINSARYFVLNRLNTAKAAMEAGYDVEVAVVNDHADSIATIEKAGMRCHSYPLSRRGLNPFSALRSLWHLFRIFRRVKPSLIHCLTIKPVILSGILCRFVRIPVIALIPGRGTAFSLSGFFGQVIGFAARTLYRIALRVSDIRVCFQNEDDLQYFIDRKMVISGSTHLIRGSGVDVEKYGYTPYNQNKGPKRTITLAARMLKEKGILEFMQAAKLVRRRYPATRFRLVGAPDPENPGSLTSCELKEHCCDADVEWLGFVEDMPRVLSESDIFCLPTYYNEGLPMTLLQASSMGKPIITTNKAGCRDVAIDEETALVVPPKRAQELSQAIIRLVESPKLCHQLSCAGRKRVEELFSASVVTSKTLHLYDQLLENAS